MDKNPYDDTTISWLPQSPIDRNKPITSQSSYPQGQVHARSVPKAPPTKQKRMSKQKALEVADFLKKGIAVTSVLSFGVFAWLAAGHNVGTTASKTTSSGNTPTITTPSTSSSSTSTQSGSGASTSTPSTSSSSTSTQSGSNASSSTQSNNGGFFNQGGGSSVGSSSSSSAVSSTTAS